MALGNWARPRDLAHFEQFRHYHETFYAQVEALSVTPFSPTSLARGIDGLLISMARVVQGSLADGLSPERSAWRIKDQRTAVERMCDRLKKRIEAAAQLEAPVKQASDLLVNRLDRWVERAKRAAEMSKTLVYERTGEDDKYLPLIMSPENARAAVGIPARHRSSSPTQCARSNPTSTFSSALSRNGCSPVNLRVFRTGCFPWSRSPDDRDDS